MDQLACNGDKKLQPDRSQAIRERLRGKGLPTGKCFLAGEGHGKNGPVGDHVCGVDFAAKETEYWSPCLR